VDHSKLFEINAYLHNHKLDGLILNETWLKKSIHNNEGISNRNYDVRRSERTLITHPADPNNPNKFRKNGGDVLIAIRSNINASVKRKGVYA
jgi:hypothetical protein